ncbi:MAG: class I tRNA ligase family protein, partial [Anaerolineales bacterium]|nr:class I tRNA ligase family protein [Anaerolineales bacterium]
ANAGSYAGMDRFACREKLWADMEAAGLTIRKQDYTLNVPRSQRGGEIIEPLVSKQWFVEAKPMAELGLAAVKSGRIKIVPERFNKVWFNWLENIRPWCISRQLWWGHQIPVWYVNGDESQFVVAHDEEAAYAEARMLYGPGVTLERDPDVLDTWFSSGLWPFSTLGWPDETPDLARYYPTDVMETGYDILFFWVARMVMSGLLFTNDIPFHTIYLHGLVRDELGRKMSKTTGNVTDPIEVMEDLGTDALRFTLLTGGTPGNDLNLSLEKVASNRNFANKIWNLARFIIMNLEKVSGADRPDTPNYSAADQWIRSRASAVVAAVDRLMDSYQFGEAGRQINDFLWGEFADWYVEIAKVQLREGGAAAWTTMSVLQEVLDLCLRLLHPFIPYVTEETWQQMKAAFTDSGTGIAPAEGWAEALIIARWPEPAGVAEAAVNQFERVRDLVRTIRAARADNKVEPARWIAASIAGGASTAFLQSQAAIIAELARLDGEQLQIAATAEAPDAAITLSLGEITCYLPLAGMVDLSKEKERLEGELADIEKQLARVSNLLNGPFAQKAPEAVVAKEREKLAQLEASRDQVTERLAQL